MTGPPVTVAVPVLDGGPVLEDVLAAVGAQQLDRPVELLVADSGSGDGSVERARAHGAQVIHVPPGAFGHGTTRNLLMERASGSHVAFLTQDAVPASPRWLERLLEGFEAAEDVALVFGPYLPRPGASQPVRRELAEFFASLAPGGAPRVDRGERGSAAPDHPGPRTYFTSANGCVLRAAWERVPFRPVRYAEDQLLAVEMLRAGWAKVFHPGAGVVHSHDYGAADLFRRYFDEWRGLREVYGWVQPAAPRGALGRVVREVGADRAFLRAEGAGGAALLTGVARSGRYHATRWLGSLAGSRADRLPPALRRRWSLEGRASFEPYAHPPWPAPGPAAAREVAAGA